MEYGKGRGVRRQVEGERVEGERGRMGKRGEQRFAAPNMSSYCTTDTYGRGLLQRPYSETLPWVQKFGFSSEIQTS